MGDCVVAVDVGGTTVKGARYANSGAQTASLAFATASAGRGDDLLEAVIEFTGRLAADAGVESVAAVGVVSPGADPATGRVNHAANLGWRDVPLAAALQDALGRPVAVDHDVRAAARAEATLGGRPDEDFLFVALGTGVAAAQVVGGCVLRGATGRAGEFGHAVVTPGGRPCGCGQRGCLEVYASAEAIARRYAELGGSATDAAGVAARLGTDECADQAWAEAVQALATGLGAATALVDPGRIVLGGGLAAAGERLVEPLRAALARRASWRPVPAINISTLGPDAGLVGAAQLAWVRAGRADVIGGWTHGPPSGSAGAPEPARAMPS